MTRRTDRVADLLRREMSEIIRLEMRDPRVRLATVSGIEVSPDLSHARVRVSIVGEDEDREACVATLQKASGFIRHHLAQRLDLRIIPQLRFQLDRGVEHSLKIDEILESLHRDDDGA